MRIIDPNYTNKQGKPAEACLAAYHTIIFLPSCRGAY